MKNPYKRKSRKMHRTKRRKRVISSNTTKHRNLKRVKVLQIDVLILLKAERQWEFLPRLNHQNNQVGLVHQKEIKVQAKLKWIYLSKKKKCTKKNQKFNLSILKFNKVLLKVLKNHQNRLLKGSSHSTTNLKIILLLSSVI